MIRRMLLFALGGLVIIGLADLAHAQDGPGDDTVEAAADDSSATPEVSPAGGDDTNEPATGIGTSPEDVELDDVLQELGELRDEVGDFRDRGDDDGFLRPLVELIGALLAFLLAAVLLVGRWLRKRQDE